MSGDAPSAILDLIEQLVPACKRHGIRRVVAAGVELEFGAAGGGVDLETMKKFQAFMEQGVPSDEEVLFHSAPGFPTPEGESLPPAPTARQRKAGS